MKRKILLLLAIVLSVGGYAQKGRSGVGLGLTYGLETSDYYEAPNQLGISLKYQYGISNMFEIEPSFTYYVYGGEGNTNTHYYKWSSYASSLYRLNYALGVNLHTYFLKTRLRPYLITGFQAYGVRWPEYEVTLEPYYVQGKLVVPSKETETVGGEKGIKPAAHVGIGADFRLFYHSNLQLEAGYDTYLLVFANFSYVYKF